jgi:hypothetical protein
VQEANGLFTDKRLDEALGIYEELYGEIPGDLDVTFNLAACGLDRDSPEGNNEGWVFPSERIVTSLLPDNVCADASIRAWSRGDSIGLTSPSCDGRIPLYTRTRYGPQDYR